MKFFSLFIILIFLIACAERRSPVFIHDDFEIYSIVIDSLYPDNCGIPDRQEIIKTVFLVDSTSIRFLWPQISAQHSDGTSRRLYLFEDLFASLAIHSTQMIDDFLEMNTIKHSLPIDSLVTNLQIVPLKTTVAKDQKLDDFYENLNRRHHDACGFLAVSAVGYNKARDLAIVNYELHCGPLCGNGAYAIFEKKHNKWIKIGYRITFES